MQKNKKKAIVIAGATASGKSAVALFLAKKLDGIIINADSIQLYDGLHLLTAQPSCEEQKEAPHKLYAILPAISDLCSAIKWRNMALEEIDKAFALKKIPIIVGGSGFYIKALIEGLSPIPEIPNSIRNQVSDIFKNSGKEALQDYLKANDSEIIKKIDMNNPARLMRAVEVLKATGKSLSYWQNIPKENVRDDIDFIEIVLRLNREILYSRCNKRFETMIELGVLDEIKYFISLTKTEDEAMALPLSRALGFKELLAYLQGKISKDDAVLEAQKITRNYAKRQTTWFKNQMQNALILNSTQRKDIETIVSHLL